MKLRANYSGIVFLSFVLTGCGNPGDVSDDFYEEYKGLAAPKILYSCSVMKTDLESALNDTTKCLEEPSEENCKDKDYIYEDVSVFYTSSRSNLLGYNALLMDSKIECEEADGTFSVLESEK